MRACLLTEFSRFDHSGFSTTSLGTQLIVCDSRVPSRLPVPTLPSTDTTATAKPTIYGIDAVYAAYITLAAGTASNATTGTTTGTTTDTTIVVGTTSLSGGGSSPLSLGATAGIGVGAAVAVLALGSIIYLLVRRAVSKKRAREVSLVAQGQGQWQGQGYDRGPAEVAEMGGAEHYYGSRTELAGDGYRREMPG